jgi:hypothetical protein
MIRGELAISNMGDISFATDFLRCQKWFIQLICGAVR